VIAAVPKRYKEDVAATFPGLDVEGLLIVPTCQNSAVDLVQMGDEVETEKDRLLERVRLCYNTHTQIEREKERERDLCHHLCCREPLGVG
jgi:hypothetical protein